MIFGGVFGFASMLLLLCLGVQQCVPWLQALHESDSVQALRAVDADLEFDRSGRVVQVLANFDEFGDEELQHVSNLTYLTRLELSGSAVTDNGLRQLAELKGLKQLFLYNTEVSHEAVESLTRDLPDCRVFSRFSVQSDFAHLSQPPELADDQMRESLDEIAPVELPLLEVVACEVGGQSTTRFVGIRYVFSTTTMTIENSKRTNIDHDYRVSWKSDPHELDILFRSYLPSRPIMGIVAIEGETMHWCWSGSERPTVFQTSLGDGRSLMTLRRVGDNRE